MQRSPWTLIRNIAAAAAVAALAPAVSAQGARGLDGSVEWREPKVRPSGAVGVSVVELVGRTEPGTEIEIDPAGVVLVQKNDEKRDVPPKVLRRRTVAGKKGVFRLPMELQHGLYQVPVRFIGQWDGERTVLLSMRVDKDAVSLNVKIKRTAKIVRVFTSRPRVFSLGLGFEPMSFRQSLRQSLEPPGQPDLELSGTAMLGLRAEADLKHHRWWWYTSAGYARVPTPPSIGGVKPADSAFAAQSYAIGGRYRALGDVHQLWVGPRVSGEFYPLAGSDGFASVHLIDLKVFRIGLEFAHAFSFAAWEFNSGFVYHAPFSVSVPVGELTYKGGSDLEFYAGVGWRFNAGWSVRAVASHWMSAFDYEYYDSAAAIANVGGGRVSESRFLLQARYSFAQKPARGGNQRAMKNDDPPESRMPPVSLAGDPIKSVVPETPTE